MTRRIVVFAPHPDDEVLGVGGAMARFAAAGDSVTVVIVTRGYPPFFDTSLIGQGRCEAAQAHGLLGVAHTEFLDLPAAELDRVPHRELNAALHRVVVERRPDIVFMPFPGDIHRDHQAVAASTLVAVRPSSSTFPPAVYAYETLSETNWNAPYLSPGFLPNVYIDISDHLDVKLRAIDAFSSQMRAFPNERSREAVRALANLRGSTVSRAAAEAFVLIRQMI